MQRSQRPGLPSYPSSCRASDDLPEYTNSISVTAFLPRKMEFDQGPSGPVLAKDRAWRTVWCCIDGTSLKIYRDTRVLPHRFRPSSSGPTHMPSPVKLADIGTLVYTPFTQDDAPSSSHRLKSASLLLDAPGHRLSRCSTSSTSTSSSGSFESFYAPAPPPEAARFLKPSALVRQYTLQGAKCGLAIGYDKRAHVIRIRAEGEQFLLQLPDLPSLVHWIESIQAAVDVSLDLDERPMPSGPCYPRHPHDR